ncbi:S1/P1 nuclease [Rhodohalobacter halophilus]|uniref:S1/P1 nuclease n=1 Tax=Rhodohalobacter halophilus TaxID=1812810 RepID=UPI000A0332CD|nr:S1/P1 nuclease [Rhodohalobacter halophilus]
MNILTLFFALLIISPFEVDTHNNEKWGQIGHYVTGEVADAYLQDDVRERVYEILDGRSMALSSVWMDDIRSDSEYDYTRTWHWATIPDGKTYEEAEQDEGGDIIWALETLIEELKQGGLTEKEERDKLRMVMHMIGDIHQPLHVGTGEDMGGNQVRLQWMGNDSNLHRVWDSDIINSLQMSYTEIAWEIDYISEEEVEELQSATVRDWAYESMSMRDRVYNLPDNMRIGYEYRYVNRDAIFDQLLKAGIRMAGVLNEIYGER